MRFALEVSRWASVAFCILYYQIFWCMCNTLLGVIYIWRGFGFLGGFGWKLYFDILVHSLHCEGKKWWAYLSSNRTSWSGLQEIFITLSCIYSSFACDRGIVSTAYKGCICDSSFAARLCDLGDISIPDDTRKLSNVHRCWNRLWCDNCHTPSWE